ncbi:hypothetical protein EE612_003384 [Oryza sativa]|nr:hypothetical protein EE612_003384 [Oryza sativa]
MSMSMSTATTTPAVLRLSTDMAMSECAATMPATTAHHHHHHAVAYFGLSCALAVLHRRSGGGGGGCDLGAGPRRCRWSRRRELALRERVGELEREVEELRRRRGEDARANEKVAGIFAAHEQRWFAERKGLRRQVHAVVAAARAREAAHGEAVAELTRQLEEQEQRAAEAAEQEAGRREEAEGKLRAAEEAAERAGKEAQEHAAELRKHGARGARDRAAGAGGGACPRGAARGRGGGGARGGPRAPRRGRVDGGGALRGVRAPAARRGAQGQDPLRDAAQVQDRHGGQGDAGARGEDVQGQAEAGGAGGRPVAEDVGVPPSPRFQVVGEVRRRGGPPWLLRQADIPRRRRGAVRARHQDTLRGPRRGRRRRQEMPAHGGAAAAADEGSHHRRMRRPLSQPRRRQACGGGVPGFAGVVQDGDGEVHEHDPAPAQRGGGGVHGAAPAQGREAGGVPVARGEHGRRGVAAPVQAPGARGAAVGAGAAPRRAGGAARR